MVTFPDTNERRKAVNLDCGIKRESIYALRGRKSGLRWTESFPLNLLKPFPVRLGINFTFATVKKSELQTNFGGSPSRRKLPREEKRNDGDGDGDLEGRS